jgi:alkaline phosphatase
VVTRSRGSAAKGTRGLVSKPRGYQNGPGAVSGERPDLTGVDTKAKDFKQQALVPFDSETHGGEDVAIYARGPFAHLFQGTMEENAIYWVMAKAFGFWTGGLSPSRPSSP